ncbi:MAG: hypothetical protein WD336_10110, partial [Trueperaceae bacterium]
MKYLPIAGCALMVVVAGAALLAGALGPSPTAEASFHQMRVYEVMGGANGDATIQYVELRMAAANQNSVGNKSLCFYDAGGAPWARFVFPTAVNSSTADESSILVGTAAMNAAWPGTPDFVFGAANMTAINVMASVDAPVPQPAGKVAFGTAAEGCGVFSPVDSLAYGSAYTGAVDFPGKFASDLPTAGTQTIKLTGAICIACLRINSVDYALVDANQAGNHPRSNSGSSGPIGDGAPTPTIAATPTATIGKQTATPTPTDTPVATATATATPPASATATGIATPAASGSATGTGGPSPTVTPTPTATPPSGTPPPTGTPIAKLVQGDVDCDGDR